MWGNKISEAKGLLLSGAARNVWGPIFLVVMPPLVAHFMTYAQFHHSGSFADAALAIYSDPRTALPNVVVAPTWTAARYLGAWLAFQATLLAFLPGRSYKGPVTPGGNVPVYTDNGFLCFVVMLATYLVGAVGLNHPAFAPEPLIAAYPAIITTMNLSALALCTFVYFKGLYAPSSSDSGTNGNLFMDFYWGTELYPRVFGIDIKQFINCRNGMMLWALAPIIVAHATANANSGVIPTAVIANAVITLVYCSKFFWWETGYLSSLDIMHDRAGFYLLWGCSVWIPTLYISPSIYLLHHPSNAPEWLSLAALVFGVLFVYVNYDADDQRATTRATKGQCVIWGRKPAIIIAAYTTEKASDYTLKPRKACDDLRARIFMFGETRSSLLLVGGWWAVSRHFHYVPEILAALCWSLPGGFTHFMPYAYVSFLALLLTDRAFRDDARCQSKYGQFWTQYCTLVPYKILPGIV